MDLILKTNAINQFHSVTGCMQLQQGKKSFPGCTINSPENNPLTSPSFFRLKTGFKEAPGQ